jgi:hypothetical protein
MAAIEESQSAQKLPEIRQKLTAGEFKFSRHAFRRAVERNISNAEIERASERAIIIEDYPGDKYSPSCLLLGCTFAQRPLHILVSLADAPLVKIITLYEPDPVEWDENFSQRR